jgi:hypothetical protein
MHQGSDPMVNTDAKQALLGGGHYQGGHYQRGALLGGSMLPQKILKSGVPDWLKMHLPYNICYIIL